MVRYVYCTASTLDGYLADDADSLDWLLNVPGAQQAGAFASFLDGVGTLVMGSTTFDWVYRHERLDEHPERWHDAYADRPAFVFSSREVAPVAGPTSVTSTEPSHRTSPRSTRRPREGTSGSSAAATSPVSSLTPDAWTASS